MWYLQFHFVCAKLFVILDCSFIFSSDWVYFVVGRPLISYPIGGFLSISSAEPLLNSRDYRGVFVDTKNKPEQECSDLFAFGDSKGNRTPVTTVKGWCLNRLTMEPYI